MQSSIYRTMLVGVLLLSLGCSTALFAASHATKRSHHSRRATLHTRSSSKRNKLTAAYKHEPRSRLLHRKATLQTQISGVRKKLKQVKKHEQRTSAQLHQVENQLRIARGQLQYAVMRFERSKVELKRATLALRDAKNDFADARQHASQRLVALYQRGDAGYLDMLVSANDYGEMLERAQLANYMMAQDRDALKELKQRKEKMANEQQTVKAITAKVASEKEQVAVIHEQTDLHRKEVARELTSVRSEANGLSSELDVLERDSAALSSMLLQMQNTTAGRRRFNTVYVGHLGGGMLPIRGGRITSPFGWRIHPISGLRLLHTGVDVAAPMGTPIMATGGGEIIYAGWRGGYGNAVVIDHGHGRSTLYGHMSKILVSVGQVVVRGQVIGRVGSTGMSTGPHCHYELRINGVPVPPL